MPDMKFREGQYVLELKRYIDGTYKQHYSNKSGLQVQEILKDLEIGKEFCQGNAIKYLMRYGKKKGYNRDDLMKALHYTILMMYYHDEKTEDDYSALQKAQAAHDPYTKGFNTSEGEE